MINYTQLLEIVITNSTRKRSEVYIKKNNMLVAAVTKDGFLIPPGGKIDKNETPEKAAIREAQEEVHMLCDNLQKIEEPLLLKYNKPRKNDDNPITETSSYTHFFVADFKKNDNSKKNNKDTFKPLLITPDEWIKDCLKEIKEKKDDKFLKKTLLSRIKILYKIKDQKNK